jgi:hypothetical protein
MVLSANYPQTYPQQLWTIKNPFVLAEITPARYITALIYVRVPRRWVGVRADSSGRLAYLADYFSFRRRRQHYWGTLMGVTAERRYA